MRRDGGAEGEEGQAATTNEEKQDEKRKCVKTEGWRTGSTGALGSAKRQGPEQKSGLR